MMPRSPLPPHRRLWLAAWALLAAGLLAAAVLAFGQDSDGDSAGEEGRAMAYKVIDGKVFPVPLDDRSPEMREVLRLGGGGGAFIYRLDHWLGSLWHGRRLAATVLVLAAGTALLCFHIAGLMREGEGDAGDSGGGGGNLGGGRGGGGGWGTAVRPPRHGRHRRARRRAHALPVRPRQLPR